MFEFLEMIRVGIFGYVVPGLMATYAVLVGIYVLWYICSSLDPEVPAWFRAYSKLEMLGFGLLNVVCTHWFFIWKADMAAQALAKGDELRPDIYTLIALVIFSIVLYIPVILRCLFIPMWLTGLVYLGIAVFGV